jgi:hypothetical protein
MRMEKTQEGRHSSLRRQRHDSPPGRRNRRSSSCQPPEFPGGTRPEFSRALIPASIAHRSGMGDCIMSSQIPALVSSRDRSLRYLLIACTLLVAIVSMLIGIKASAAPLWSGAAFPQQTINSARKGDRLPLQLASEAGPARRIEVNAPRRSVEHGLPDGCEAVASPLTRTTVSQIAGRCVS